MAIVNSIKPHINFKRTSGGRVFRGPNPWLLGKSPHYLVSVDQRTRIITALRTVVREPGDTLPLSIMPVIAAIVIISVAVVWELDVITVMFFIAVVCLVFTVGTAAAQSWRLKPILVHASPTYERITYAEMRKADEDSTSPKEARQRCIMLVLY